MLPYYKYSGQGNLFTPRGYAQGTLVDLLSSREPTDTTEELLEDTTELNQPTFEEVQDSGTQSFFNGMDVREGDNLSFDDLSDLSLTDGLFGGITVSDNAPKGWNTQHQREFDALVAAGLKPQAKWTGNDWYVFAKELDGTPFGEPGTMSLADSFTSGGKYGGQPIGLFGSIAGAATGSFKPEEVFQKNLAEALQEKTSPEEFTELQQESFAAPVAEGIEEFTELQPVQKDEGSVTAKRGGTVTAKEGGTVTAKRPTPDPKPKPVPLKQVIANAMAKQKEKDNREQEKKNRTDTTAIEQVRSRGKDLGSFRRGYGF
tara:strand:- start:411 stop:1358 length:948 start_codon:yes stop_codon:yes gene_type:complete